MKRHALSEVALMSGPGEDEDAVFRRGLPAVDLFEHGGFVHGERRRTIKSSTANF
jgi:hypothetical protein